MIVRAADNERWDQQKGDQGKHRRERETPSLDGPFAQAATEVLRRLLESRAKGAGGYPMGRQAGQGSAAPGDDLPEQQHGDEEGEWAIAD